MLPRLSFHVAFPPCQAPKALALHALRPIAGAFYRAFFSLRREWIQSFHPATCGRLAGIFVQATFLVHYKGTFHSYDMSPPRFS